MRPGSTPSSRAWRRIQRTASRRSSRAAGQLGHARPGQAVIGRDDHEPGLGQADDGRVRVPQAGPVQPLRPADPAPAVDDQDRRAEPIGRGRRHAAGRQVKVERKPMAARGAVDHVLAHDDLRRDLQSAERPIRGRPDPGGDRRQEEPGHHAEQQGDSRHRLWTGGSASSAPEGGVGWIRAAIHRGEAQRNRSLKSITNGRRYERRAGIPTGAPA